MGALVNNALFQMLFSVDRFSAIGLGVHLRNYQLAPARAIVRSVIDNLGLTFVVMMSRQSGKNELSAIIEAYLMTLYQRAGGQVVKAAPTELQFQISQDRLMTLTRSRWTPTRRTGHRVTLGNASTAFLSAYADTNVVGHTASLLLECDEAQDVDPTKWEKDFVPMAASTDATTVFYGTPWLRSDLLGRMKRQAIAEQDRDGIERLFAVPWPLVTAEVPAYKAYLQKQRAKLGPDHPLFLSQYELVEVDESVGMFPPPLQFMMRGQHLPHAQPMDGERYYLTIDVGGETPKGEDTSDTRDSTVITVFTRRPMEHGSLWEVRHRHVFTGEKPETVTMRVVEIWRPLQVIVDATGIGAGVASHLAAHHPNVLPFVFGLASKSALGWAFVGLCRQGRFLDHAPDGSAEQALFRRQLEAAKLEVRPGPGRLCSWGVPASEGHDDLLISAALVAELDRVALNPYQAGDVIEAADVIAEMDKSRF